MPLAWLETYGPWAVLLGGILEGESVFVAAGYAIARGYLDPATTFACAVLGGSLGDGLYYLIGRVFGPALLRRVPRLRRPRARAVLLLRRWGPATAFVARFAYGLRVVLPLSLGAAGFPALPFLVFNLLGSLAFSALYLGIGYVAGGAAADAAALLRYALIGVAGLVAAGLVLARGRLAGALG